MASPLSLTRRGSSAPREVVNVIGAKETLRSTFPITRQPEVRERQDGTWSLWYSDPNFCPCDCSKKCKAETSAGPGLIEVRTPFPTMEAALQEARDYCCGGEPKVICIETHSERMQRIWAERRQAKEQSATAT